MPTRGNSDPAESAAEAAQAELVRLREALAIAERDRAATQALLDTSVLAITHLALDGTILMVNTTGARNMRGVPADFHGRQIFEIFPELEAQTRQRIEQTCALGQPLSFETAVSLPGGERWFRSTYYPVAGADGRQPSVQLISQDITELKRMEQVLEATEGQLASVLQHAPHLVLLLDPDGVVRYANRLSDADSIYSTIGAQAIASLPQASAEAFAQSLRRVLTSASPDLIEIDDLACRSWEIRLAPIMRRGQVHQLLAFAVDVTQRRSARERERELERQVQHAQKLESLGVLAGGIAHDFNNLLVGILGNAQLVLGRATSAETRAQLQAVVQGAQRAADLCRQMLAYAGRSEPRFEAIDLSELASEILDLVRASLSKGTRVTRECPSGLPLVEGDATQLGQVVMNLLTNASAALGDGQGEVGLRCGITEDASPSERRVYVEVRDDGCGMDADTQRRMFEPFFTTKRLGSGLGLAAVLGIVRSHRGTIQVDSAPGKGTTIRVELPEAPPRATLEPRAPSARPALSPKTVLLVDDEPAVRRVARRVLEGAGHHVIEASDGLDALARYFAEPRAIDAVVLDLNMPRMNGGQVLTQLRSHAPDLPVLLNSGFHPSREERAQWQRDPATRFIAKPYSVDDLLAALDAVLRARAP